MMDGFDKVTNAERLRRVISILQELHKDVELYPDYDGSIHFYISGDNYPKMDDWGFAPGDINILKELGCQWDNSARNWEWA